MDKCICKEDLNRDPKYWGHIFWCPQSPASIRYDKLPWYEKLFQKNPQSERKDFIKVKEDILS